MRNTIVQFGIWILMVFTGNQLFSQNNTSENFKKWLDQATELRFKNPDSARLYCQKILLEAEKTENNQMKAEALRIMSISYEAQGDYKEGLHYGLESLALWRKIGDDSKIANVLNSVGIIYDQQGNFYEALRYYNEAYTIYKNSGDDEHLAMMNVNLGILFKSQGEYAQVIRHYKDAYAIYNRLKLPAEIAFCEANLGSVYYYTKQYDSCVYYSLKAEQALQEQKNLQFMPVAQANAGIGYLALGKLTEAKTYLQKALKAHRQYGNKKEISFVLIQLARLYEKQDQSNEAYQSLMEAKELALSIKSPQQVMESSKLLADYYLKKEDYKNAYSQFVAHSSVKDTLFEQQKTKEITNHQVRYETERKEQEIALLTQKNKIQQFGIRQRNLYLFIAALLVTGAAVTIWLLYRNRKIKEEKLKKEASLQAELLKLEAQNTLQKDRLRISRDLHDNIGANLTFIHTSLNEISTENDVQNKQWSEMKAMLNETIAELRRTVWLINKSSVNTEEWIIRLREYYRRIQKVQVVAETDHYERILTSKEATALFRIVQEAVNNALKHAGASKIEINIGWENTDLRILISDDGEGFSLGKTTGFGLGNMQQNAEDIGADFHIKTLPGKGTEIEVRIQGNTQ